MMKSPYPEEQTRTAVDWYNNGVEATKEKDYARAITCYDEALKLDPKQKESWNGKGSVYSNQGNHNEAVNCFDAAIRIDPNYTTAWNSKGIALSNQGKYQEALQCHEKVLTINPSNTTAKTNLEKVRVNLAKITTTTTTTAQLQPTRKTGHTEIGGKYALVNKVNLQEAQALKEQTGLVVKFEDGSTKAKLVIGQGQFGKLKLAQDLSTKKYCGVKKIKTADKIAESRREAEMQRKLSGLHNVLPLLDSVEMTDSENKPVIYHFMPLAGFGNGDVLTQIFDYSKKAKSGDVEQKRRQVVIHVARSLLNGLRNMHSKHIYHCDFKPNNFVIDAKGEVYIIDFGCAVESKTGKINYGAIGDWQYFSPERYESGRQVKDFDGAKNDAWALGVALIEIMTGKYPFDYCDNEERFSTWNENYFRNKLKEIKELQNPKAESIWAVIAGLAEPNPNKRLSIEQALGKPAFKDDNYQAFSSARECQEAFEYMKNLLINPSFSFRQRAVTVKAVEQAQQQQYAFTDKATPTSTTSTTTNNVVSITTGKNRNYENITSIQQRDAISSKALPTAGTFSGSYIIPPGEGSPALKKWAPPDLSIQGINIKIKNDR